MVSETACELLLLLLLILVLAVTLAMNAFLRLTLLALGGVPLLACVFACHNQNTRCSRTDISALLSPQRSGHAGFRLVCR